MAATFSSSRSSPIYHTRLKFWMELLFVLSPCTISFTWYIAIVLTCWSFINSQRLLYICFHRENWKNIHYAFIWCTEFRQGFQQLLMISKSMKVNQANIRVIVRKKRGLCGNPPPVWEFFPHNPVFFLTTTLIITLVITMIIVIMSIMVVVWCITEASEAGSCLSRIPLTGAGHRLRTDTRQLRALSKAKKIRNQDHPEAFKLYLKSELPKLWLCVHK